MSVQVKGRNQWWRGLGSLPRLVSLAAVGLMMQACGHYPATTFAPRSNLTQSIQDLYFEVIGWDSLILLLVVALVVLIIVRYSTRPTGRPTPPPPVFESRALEVAWVAGPALILAFIAVPSLHLVYSSQRAKPPADALIINITAHQWWWQGNYPQLGIQTANEFHIPVNRPVRFIMRSADVIHSFWIPQLGAKRDVVPGHVNEITFTPDKTGEYFGECAEFCGLGHTNMRFRVFVDSPTAFANWATDQTAPPHAPASGPARKGQMIFSTSACTPCHTIRGFSTGKIAPDLTHFASRTTFGGGTFKNTPQNVAKWITNPSAMKPGAQMPALGLSGPELKDLVAYLESLK